MALSADELFMREALDLARKGVGLASPNPCVGAVVVDERGRIIGRGTHIYDNLKHAEILALEQAGEKARGNTLYLNLEPCSHTGRTGPCADAVIAAGIHRVVCSMQDPNPKVSGQGFERLRAAGIEVEIGLFEDEAKTLNEAFAKFIRTRKPLVVLKGAVTLDGRIGAGGKKGFTTYISGPEALKRIHLLRHESDAIMVGIATIEADNPQLTDRSGLPRRRPIMRCVLDSRLRIALDSKLVESSNNDVTIFCVDADPRKHSALESRGVRVEQVAGDADGRVDLTAALNRMGEMKLLSVLVEGGSLVNARFLHAGAVDKLLLFFTPKILGGCSIPWLAEGVDIPRLDLSGVTVEQVGDEFFVQSYLRDPYSAVFELRTEI
jgi:diaminohydroxyphosphoribosylaminopyrimidine deaminase / 5-amino-6-(5-phosphoribosylamino)uracil reductase